MAERDFLEGADAGMMGADRMIGRRDFIIGMSVLATCAATTMVGCSNNTSNKDSKSDASGRPDECISITDQLGKTIVFDSVPTRVASTIIPFPSIYYALMGDTDTMVGANPSSMPAYEKSVLKTLYPSFANVETGWCSRDFIVNAEELLKLKPDVVFQWTTQPNEIKKMEDAGLKVVALQYGSVDDLKTWITMLGALFKQEERAQFIIDYFDSQLLEVDSRINGLADSDKPVAIHLSENLTVNGSGFTPYWMEKSGANDPAATFQSQSVKVDMEQMLNWNPDFIYIGNFTEIQPSDLMENKLDGQDWSQIKAVQKKQVYKIPIGGYRWDPPCVETPLMVKWLAKIQHPDLLRDMDMSEEVQTFYRDVYDYNLSAEELSAILDHRQD